MRKRYQVVLLVVLSLAVFTALSSAVDETPEILFENVRELIKEGKAGMEKGDIKVAGDKYRTASYLLEKIIKDFPEWNFETAARELESCSTALEEIKASRALIETHSKPAVVTCRWRMINPGSDFEPGEGHKYKICLKGEDLQKLHLSFKKLKPHESEARLSIQIKNTSNNTVIQDIKNKGLFQKEEGEFELSLFVPSGSILYLAEFTENKYSEPVVLSNILKLP